MSKKRCLLLIIAWFSVTLLAACQVLPRASLATAAPLPSLTSTLPPEPSATAVPATDVPTPQPSITPSATTYREPTATADTALISANTTDLSPSPTLDATHAVAVDDVEGLVLTPASSPGSITPQPSDAIDIQPFEQRLIQLINAEREKAGLKDLRTAFILTIIAQDHSDEMAEDNIFGHNSQSGLTLEERLKKGGYTFSAAAENLFAGSGPYNSPEYVVQVWLNSPTHRENMLNPVYTEVGVGYRFSASSTYGGYFTADFGTP